MSVTNYYSVGGFLLGEETVGSGRTDYLTDALGSVTATVNQAGTVQNTYRYKPYGSQLAKTGVGSDPAFQWVGGYGYRQTNRTYSDVYVRARHYASATASWTTRDPMLYTVGTNLYCYTLANPTSLIDSTGLDTQTRCGCGCDNSKAGSVCGYAKCIGLDHGDLGGIVCCDGIATICEWTPPGTREGIKHCILEHERDHLRHFFCPCQAGACRGKNTIDKNQSECEAYWVEISCLIHWRDKNCPWIDLKCRPDYHKAICSACAAASTYNCNLPAICNNC